MFIEDNTFQNKQKTPNAVLTTKDNIGFRALSFVDNPVNLLTDNPNRNYSSTQDV